MGFTAVVLQRKNTPKKLMITPVGDVSELQCTGKQYFVHARVIFWAVQQYTRAQQGSTRTALRSCYCRRSIKLRHFDLCWSACRHTWAPKKAQPLHRLFKHHYMGFAPQRNRNTVGSLHITNSNAQLYTSTHLRIHSYQIHGFAITFFDLS